MDLSKLTKADRILFGAGIVFLISTFLNWFTVRGFGGGATGWDLNFFWGGLPFLVVLALLVWVGLARFSDVKVPEPVAVAFLAGGGLVALLPLLKFVIGEDLPIVEVNRSFGLFLAVLAGLGFAFGGFLKFQETGGDIDALKAQIKDATQGKGEGN